MGSQDRPLLTFAVGAYKQERFIREAVECAFAQTYSPLEIVLSDDCSDDRTFDIMREMAASYTGPHRLVLNRNPVRKSIGGHVNRVVEISRGELIISAAGDDISLPHRTETIYQAWNEAGRPAASIHSSVIQIDENGNVMEGLYRSASGGEARPVTRQEVKPWEYLEEFQPLVFGAAHAFSRRAFEVFGPLPEEVLHEDTVIPFRALLLCGQFISIREPLVKYRLHGNNVFLQNRNRVTDAKSLSLEDERLRRDCKHRKISYQVFRADLLKAKSCGLIGEDDFKRTSEGLSRKFGWYAQVSEFLDAGFFRRCQIVLTLRREGLSAKQLKPLVARLLPRQVLSALLQARNQQASASSGSA